jgi:hypothetical protein
MSLTRLVKKSTQRCDISICAVVKALYWSIASPPTNHSRIFSSSSEIYWRSKTKSTSQSLSLVITVNERMSVKSAKKKERLWPDHLAVNLLRYLQEDESTSKHHFLTLCEIFKGTRKTRGTILGLRSRQLKDRLSLALRHRGWKGFEDKETRLAPLGP